MSLIEKAIEKMKVAGVSPGATGASARVEVKAAPERAPLADRQPANEAAVAPPAPVVAQTAAVAAPAQDAQIRRKSPSQNIVVDTNALAAVGVLAPPESMHQQASEYRHIKRQLLNTIRGASPVQPHDRLIMVASAISGEGKTFNAVNLSLSLALERDYSVLLVDADVAKPNVSRLFGVEKSMGLLDAARDEGTDVEDLVIGTDVRGLSLLPAGRMSPNATEHLSSARMQTILRQLVANPTRLVVLDSPPLLMTTESAALSQLVGRVVLVVRAEWTPHRAVIDALEILGDRPGIRLILNRARHTAVKGYYYGYNAYYGRGPTKPNGEGDAI